MIPSVWLQSGAGSRLISLAPVDFLIIGLYFVAVIGIGIYLKNYTKTGEDFFLAGREMTAWVAGLSFLAANLGSLELMGWAASAYQYGILATHWYWIGAIPAMLFLALVMIPFYYISKTHSVPGYLKLRFGENARTLSAVSFGLMTVLMSGINMFSMAKVMNVILGWDMDVSIWVSAATVAGYVFLGGLLSAIFNEVLQFVLIWLGSILIAIIGLIETGGWSGMVARIHERFPGQDYTHLWSSVGTFHDNPMGINWIGIVFGLGAVISMGYWTTDFLVVQRVISAKDLRSAKMAPIIGAAFKMMVPAIVILPGLLGLANLPFHLVGESELAAHPGAHSYNDVLPLMLARYCGPGLLGPWHHRTHCGLHVRHGRQRQRLRHGVDLRHLQGPHEEGCGRRALSRDGPLVHRHRSAGEHRHGLPCDARQLHHGLRAGTFQLLHRASVRYGGVGNALETRDARGRICRAACRDRFRDWALGLGEA